MERIFVTVRARPLSAEDAKSSPWRISGNSIYLANLSGKFEFDRVFGEECKTREVYEARTKEIVASAVRGFNGTIFAYGQTNSGKTHTMRGSETEPGIIPMAVNDLFQSMQENIDREFLVRIAYMEIYNEEINDLLSPEPRRLQIHESLERGIFVAGLKEEIVSSPEQVLDLMEKGETLRHIGETNMNLHSSRSHTIFRMTVESREKTDDSHGLDQLCDAVRVSVLNLVDLAGSERAAKTGAEGVRLKEGSHINKSLMTLGTVIKKLSEGAESQGGHVPYRDSKLTRILQPALGGNANTAIICNITLAQIHTEETKSSLQFASRALRVTNCACVNEILTDAALLKRQRKEIEELRARMLASHSEHWEQEILNLRNTLLQSELEKERIALELEDEKRAKAQLEKRLQEQMSMVLEMKRDNQSTNGEKDTGQNSCFPGPSTLEVSDTRGSVDTDSPLPFEDLLQESDAAVPDNICNHLLGVGNIDSGDDYSLPDARALLHVTSRRKVHRRQGSLPTGNEMHIDTGSMEKRSECLQGKTTAEAGCTMKRDSEFSSSGTDAAPSASCPKENETLEELEAIIRAELLQEQDNMIATCKELMMEMHDIAFEVQHSSHAVEEISYVVEDLFQSFSDIFKVLLELKKFASQDIKQFNFIASSHEKLCSFMKRKSDDQETEKELLHKDATYLQAQIQELNFEAQNRGKMMDEVIRQHESEKDELCHQILSLQKEVSCLSSSSLTKERDALRKELEKTKLKLKDTDSKLKNTIQDKVRLESEKVHAEREIKRFHGQRAIIERDVNKHDSLAWRESKAFDVNKSTVHNGPVSQILQSDYEKLEIYAFEMETAIASLEEKLMASVGEREEALTRNGILEAELDALSDQLNTANSELNLMGEEIASLTLRLDESESLSQSLKANHNFILREKEEMEMQLTDALLEVEAKKSTWLTTEKVLLDTNEKHKNQIARLSEDLVKVKSETESCKNLCKNLQRNLSISEENAEAERKCRMAKSLEITQLKNDFEMLEIARLIYEVVLKSKIKELSLEQHYACEQVNKLQKQLNACQEREKSYSQSEMGIVSVRPEDIQELLTARKTAEGLSEKLINMEVKAQNEMLSNNIEKTKLRMKLRSTQAKLDAFRGRYMEAVDEMELMNNKFETASTKLKERLASYGIEILNLKKQLSTKD